MCIYCGTAKYRKIYEKHFGPIPKDDTGRSYDIHHLDGNRMNNSPDNLIAVSINEHYNIHYQQEDWGACGSLAVRMKKSSAEISALSSLHCRKMVEMGTNPFQGGEIQKRTQLERVRNGTHHWLSGKLQRKLQQERSANGTHQWQGNGDFQRENNKRRLENGTHHLLGDKNPSKIMIKNGTHHFLSSNPAKIDWKCEHCHKSGLGISNYNRWHGEKCKYKNE